MNKNILIAILVIVIVAVGATLVLNPFKANTEINIINNETFQNGEQIVFELKDSNGNPVSGQVINITYNSNETYSITTDQNGKCYLTISGEPAGKYDVEAKYAGNDKYKGCSAKTTITVTDEAPDNVGTSTGGSVASADQYNNNGNKGASGTYYIPQYELTVRSSDNVIVGGPANAIGLTLSQFYARMHKELSQEQNKTNPYEGIH